MNIQLQSILTSDTIAVNQTATVCYSRKEYCEPPDDLDYNQDYISSIMLNGKRYKLKCEIVEAYPLICTRCGHTLTLEHGHGQCPACGTNFSAVVRIVEDK